MKLFENSKQSFSISNHNKREPITRINTSNIKKKTSQNSSVHSFKSPPNHEGNIGLFLRHRSETYLQNYDYDTALFYAERLLSESDNLSNRLLVAKCYKELHKYNRAYHVLQPVLRQTQTEYQHYIQNGQKLTARNNDTDRRNDISFNIDHAPFTPIAPVGDLGSSHISGDLGFAFTAMHNHSQRNTHTPTSRTTNHLAFDHSFMSKFNTDTKENQKSTLNASIFAELNHNDETMQILLESRYFLSLICFELGRYDECEEFLLGKKWSDTRTAELPIPNGVHGVYLLAKVFHRSSRFDLAMQYYTKCIELDSYHFGAIMALSELGKDPGLFTKASEPNQAFQSKHCLIPNEGNPNNLVPFEKVDAEGYSELKSLFDNLSWGYFKLQMFYPQDGLQYFTRLPKPHGESAWVLNNTARCYYEMNDYQRATSNWKRQLELYPFDMKGMDYYSTALWHLKQAKELTLLSQHCSEIDKTSSSTWMVMGNCFSLHKSHDLAIKFFTKAYCISNNYAYAHTLAGHEYVVNEDFDSALKSFQNAIRIDDRHYNAWYGLANIYQFQQNYKEALYHFTKAVKINPNSSVLYVCIANIYRLQGNYKGALQFIDKALSLTDATGHYNLKARLEKANIYVLMKEYKRAIEQFKKLLEIIPNEWKIHFHLGEVYQETGNKDLALLSFNKAMALNPKDKNTIKHAIQNVYNQQNQAYGRHRRSDTNRNMNNNGNNNNGDVYRSIMEEEEDDMQQGSHLYNRRGNDMRMNSIDDEDDNDMLEDSDDDDDDDDNDQFMNASRSSIHAIGPSHSNSLSPN